MNALLNIEILASLLVGLGALECLPALVAWIYGEPALPYLLSALPPLVFGLPLLFTARAPDRRMRPRDGFLVVAVAWGMVSLFGSLPYILTGTLGPADALFESISGFTTTGSTVMTDIEASPRGVLFWRALSQWLGGMGIIVLAVAVLPLLGIGGMQLFQAEVPGPVAGKLTPRIADTARRLWFIYLGFTVTVVVALWLAGMGFFDAVCHAFTTVATGGFSTRNASIGAFNSPLIEWLVIVFMFAGGINFVLHYRILTGHIRQVSRDEELRFYVVLAVVFTLLCWWTLARSGAPDGPRSAAFQVVSIMTTTGYGTRNFEAWPHLTHFLMLTLLLTGGMAGSTSGGIKTMRLLIGARALRGMVSHLRHSRAVHSLHYAGRTVPDGVVSGVLLFFLAYLGLAILGAIAVASAGYDPVTSLSAGLTAVGNFGPGTGEIGPTDNFGHFPAYVKLTLGFCMIAGRLEIFTVLALLDPNFWRN
ncbi:MAG: TrkH family potassium uptake protein [Proteobacteria bacterium]|nr:TrkH family potassium uptake protein [Pseudomonadota bacterium]